MHLYKTIVEFDAAVCLQRQIFLFTPFTLIWKEGCNSPNRCFNFWTTRLCMVPLSNTCETRNDWVNRQVSDSN